MSGVLENPKVTLVLLGAGFDPSVAIPERLGFAGVIRSDEAAAARFITLMPGQAVNFILDWCSVTVLNDRFIVETSVPPFIKIADLILKTLGDLMPKATVNMLGINRQYSLRFASAEALDDFGVRIAPPAAWGNWGRRIQEQLLADHTKNHGGVMNVTMRETPIAGREIGWRDVQITSARTGADGFVALIALNDHFQANDAGQPPGLEPHELGHRRTAAMMRIISEQFDDSLNVLESIAKDIVGSSPS